MVQVRVYGERRLGIGEGRGSLEMLMKLESHAYTNSDSTSYRRYFILNARASRGDAS